MGRNDLWISNKEHVSRLCRPADFQALSMLQRALDAKWMKAMHAGSTKLHPDFGRPPYGMPWIVVVGRGWADGFVELRNRFTGENGNVPVDGAAEAIAAALAG